MWPGGGDGDTKVTRLRRHSFGDSRRLSEKSAENKVMRAESGSLSAPALLCVLRQMFSYPKYQTLILIHKFIIFFKH